MQAIETVQFNGTGFTANGKIVPSVFQFDGGDGRLGIDAKFAVFVRLDGIEFYSPYLENKKKKIVKIDDANYCLMDGWTDVGVNLHEVWEFWFRLLNNLSQNHSHRKFQYLCRHKC